MYEYLDRAGFTTACEEIKNKVSSGGGSSVGGLHIGQIVDTITTGDVLLPDLEYRWYESAAVVYNGEIHIMGSEYQASNGPYSYERYHSIFDGSSWRTISDLPYGFRNGSAVVYNNEIHILGSSNSSYSKYHYKFNGSSWETVSTLPLNLSGGAAVVYNNEIHVLIGANHYKFNGSSWETVSTLPFKLNNQPSVVYKDEIHAFGNDTHWVFDGRAWTKHSPITYSINGGCVVIYNDEIHRVGGDDGNSVGGVYGSQRHQIIHDRYRNIETLLPSGAHILLPNNTDIKYVSDNTVKMEHNIAKVIDTGFVSIASQFTNEEDIRQFITFY